MFFQKRWVDTRRFELAVDWKWSRRHRHMYPGGQVLQFAVCPIAAAQTWASLPSSKLRSLSRFTQSEAAQNESRDSADLISGASPPLFVVGLTRRDFLGLAALFDGLRGPTPFGGWSPIGILMGPIPGLITYCCCCWACCCIVKPPGVPIAAPGIAAPTMCPGAICPGTIVCLGAICSVIMCPGAMCPGGICPGAIIIGCWAYMA